MSILLLAGRAAVIEGFAPAAFHSGFCAAHIAELRGHGRWSRRGQLSGREVGVESVVLQNKTTYPR